jgi:hypothetical protein
VIDHIPIIGVKVFTGLICLNTLYGHAFHMSIYVLIKDEIGCLQNYTKKYEPLHQTLLISLVSHLFKFDDFLNYFVFCYGFWALPFEYIIGCRL